MKWNDWVSLLFPVVLKVVGWLIPAVGGFLGGPIGWLVAFGLAKLTAFLVDWAERAARFGSISKDVLTQVTEVRDTAKAFFEIEDRRERGEVIPPEERNAAKEKFKESARKLIKIKKPEPKPEPEPEPPIVEPPVRTVVTISKRLRKRRNKKP